MDHAIKATMIRQARAAIARNDLRTAERIVNVNFDDPLRPLGRCAEWAESWGAELRHPWQP